MIKQACKEYRIIPISDLPPAINPDLSERLATWEELAGLGIIEFDRGANNVQALTLGYYCPERGEGVDRFGNPWPGIVIAGKKGMYSAQRFPLIENNLLTYKDGANGGRTRLMQTPLVNEPIPGLEESERLKRRLPRVMGD